jgi:hypothetical protein
MQTSRQRTSHFAPSYNCLIPVQTQESTTVNVLTATHARKKCERGCFQAFPQLQVVARCPWKLLHSKSSIRIGLASMVAEILQLENWMLFGKYVKHVSFFSSRSIAFED